MIHLLTGGSGDWMNRIKMLMAQAEGAFALTIITGDAVYGVRDPWGFRPLVLGKFEGGYLLARKPVRSPPSVPNWSTNSHREIAD